MTALDDVRKLRSIDAAVAVAVFLSLVAPGFLILYVFEPAMLKDLDVVKLVIFSLGLTLPIVWFNTLVLSIAVGRTAHDGDLHLFLAVAGMTAVPPFYCSLYAAHYFGLSFDWFIALLGIGNGALLLLSRRATMKHWEARAKGKS